MVAWSSELQEEQTFPEDVRDVRREDWQKHDCHEAAAPDSQDVCALVRSVQDRPHCGNVSDAEVGRMLADRAESDRAKKRNRVVMRDILWYFVPGSVGESQSRNIGYRGFRGNIQVPVLSSPCP